MTPLEQADLDFADKPLREAARVGAECWDFEFDSLWDTYLNMKWSQPELARLTSMAVWERRALEKLRR